MTPHAAFLLWLPYSLSCHILVSIHSVFGLAFPWCFLLPSFHTHSDPAAESPALGVPASVPEKEPSPEHERSHSPRALSSSLSPSGSNRSRSGSVSSSRSESPAHEHEQDHIQFGTLDYKTFLSKLDHMGARQDKSAKRYLCNRARIMRLNETVAHHSSTLSSYEARISALERWIHGLGPNPGPVLPLAAPDRFVGAKPVGPDGDFHIRPWLDAMEAWLTAQPQLHPSQWLNTALSYLDHSARVTWTQHLLPDLLSKKDLPGSTVPYQPTWQDFKEAMAARYAGQSARIAAAKLRSHSCRYSSSMHEYSTRFRQLVDKANEVPDSDFRLKPEEQASLFLDGLPRELKIFVLSAAPAEGFSSLHQCETFCSLKQEQFSKLDISADKSRPPSSTPGSSNPRRRPRSPSRPQGRFPQNKRPKQDQKSRPSSSSFPRKPSSSGSKDKSKTRDIVCAYCKRHGHHINDCKTRPKKDSSASHPKSSTKDRTDFP